MLSRILAILASGDIQVKKLIFAITCLLLAVVSALSFITTVQSAAPVKVAEMVVVSLWPSPLGLNGSTESAGLLMTRL
jgi:hypothetical protein